MVLGHTKETMYLYFSKFYVLKSVMVTQATRVEILDQIVF
jgi:hypothetical protein